MTENLSGGSYRLEGIAFGLADGLIMCLGLIIGVAEATSNTQLVIITGIIGDFANAARAKETVLRQTVFSRIARAN